MSESDSELGVAGFRGLDLDRISQVVSYDIPYDPLFYTRHTRVFGRDAHSRAR